MTARWSRLLLALALVTSLSLPLACSRKGSDELLSEGSRFTAIQAPGVTWSCSEPRSCSTDYLALPSKVSFPAPSTTTKAAEAELNRIRDGAVRQVEQQQGEARLRSLIETATGVRPLLQHLEDRRQIRIIEEWSDAHTLGSRLLIDDPLLGSFEGILLRPRGKGPFPAVLASHGHVDEAQTFVRKYHGFRYPGAGYVFFAHSQRVSYADENEDRVARTLLDAGGSLMAVRIYETLVGLELLRSLQAVDRSRIALIGHSGGTLANLLTVRLTDGFAAHVADGIAEYNSWDDGLIADETLPALYPYSTQLSSLEGLTTPSLRVDYGYSKGPEEVWAFLGRSMTGPGAAETPHP